MRSILQSPYRYIFLIGLGLALVSAFFGIGSYQADEHFQIFEFANYLLGDTPVADLPWEFEERMRPAIQPGFTYIFLKSTDYLGIDNPWVNAFILRGITAFFVWLLICHFLLKIFEKEKNISLQWSLIILSFFLWYSPFLINRFSSENISALFLLLSIFLLQFSGLAKKANGALLIGFLFAISFYVRFQIAFALIGVGVYILWVKKSNWRTIVIMLTGFLLGIAINIFIDFWFYSDWVFTPWEYYRANIIDKKAATFGVSPFYQYIFDSFTYMAPLSILLFPLAIWGAWKNPKSIFVFVIIPFVIGHSIVAHKEMRFLFPMYVPYIILVYHGLKEIWEKRWFKKQKKLFIGIFTFLFAVNIIMLIFRIFLPGNEAYLYFKKMYKQAEKEELVLICHKRKPFVYANLHVNYYLHDNITEIVAKDEIEMKGLISYYSQSGKPTYVLSLSPQDSFRAWGNLKEFYSYLPDWIHYFDFNNWVSRTKMWIIYKIDPNKIQN